jgi:hypothetical protein
MNLDNISAKWAQPRRVPRYNPKHKKRSSSIDSTATAFATMPPETEKAAAFLAFYWPGKVCYCVAHLWSGDETIEASGRGVNVSEAAVDALHNAGLRFFEGEAPLFWGGYGEPVTKAALEAVALFLNPTATTTRIKFNYGSK